MMAASLIWLWTVVFVIVAAMMLVHFSGALPL